MDGLFLEILNLSLYGSFAIAAVLILRFLLKKSPKSISYGLWLVVFLTLILPVRIKTSYSPMPVGVESFRQEKLYQAVPQVESGISLVDDFVAERTPVRKLGEEVFPMERMVEGGKAITNHFGQHITYINVLRNMSVDCDCAGLGAAAPTTPDLGIIASTDILAVDQASVDMVYALPEAQRRDLVERIESRSGLRQLEYMKLQGMGNNQYDLITV